MKLESDGTELLFDDFILNSNKSLENGIVLERRFDHNRYIIQKSLLTSVKYDFTTEKWLEGFCLSRDFLWDMI